MRRSVVAACACGRLNRDVHAAHIALALATAATVDQAPEAGQQGYAAAVLSKQLAALGLDVKTTSRWLAGLDEEHLAGLVAEQLDTGRLRAVEG